MATEPGALFNGFKYYSMQFLLLICLMTACLPIDWSPPPFEITLAGSITFTSIIVVMLLMSAVLIAQLTRHRLIENAGSRDLIVQRYATARTYFFFANLGGFAFCLIGLGWGWASQKLGTVYFDGRYLFVPGGELLTLSPFIVSQIGSWCFFYDADREFHSILIDHDKHGHFWTRIGYVMFLMRQQLIFVFAPLFLLMGQQGFERLYPEVLQAAWLPLVSMLLLPSFLILFPLVLPTLLALKPLPPGHVRNRMEANSRRLRFRYAQIYFWDTRGGIANAMVVGIVPWIRYVVFTDRLLEDLSEEEVDAVLGHEIGHAKHGHILFYALFLMLSFVLLGVIVQTFRFEDEFKWREYRTFFLVAPVVLMGIYMFAIFGFISRRCERQADIFGCRSVSCDETFCQGHDSSTTYPEGGRGLCETGIAAFVRALSRVDEINGLTRAQIRWRGTTLVGKLHAIFKLLTGWLHTWQHSTIPKRIAFLESIARDQSIERRFQARLWLWKLTIMLGLIGSIVGVGLWKGWDVLLMAL